jgi:hypothetical protein
VTKGETEPARLEAALTAAVHQGERYVAFGELTLAEVEGRAEAIGAAGSWGPLARAAKVARAWADLAAQMRERDARTVGELDPPTVVRFAEYLWVIPPEGGMI